MRKGASPVDFAMALSVMIAVIAFSVFYITNYFSNVSPNGKTSELRSSAAGIEKILFGTAGIPQNWESNNYTPVRAGLRTDLKRIAIAAAEKGGANHSFEEADLHVVFDTACANKTYNNSIRIYDRFMNETPFRIYNSTECAANSGFLREANIDFLFNITGNTSQVFWLYYTNNTATPKKSAYNFSYDSSLVGYWKLDSVNASNYTLDSTVNRNDGKLYNYSCDPATCNLTAGQINSALSFNGTNNYVDAGNGASLNIQNAITIEAWIYPKNLTSSTWGNGIVSNWKPSGAAYTFRQWGNKINFAVTNSTAYDSVFGTTTLNPNSWYHVAGTYDGSNIKVYVNGIFENSISHTGTIPVSGVSTEIGRDYADNTRMFNGTIDNVRIWNRSLSAEEIKALYNYTRPNYVVSSGTVLAVADKKISAFQNLSYADAKNSLDLKNNFNITACEYGLGRHIPDTVNVMASSYPIIVINSSGSVKPCLASVNVW